MILTHAAHAHLREADLQADQQTGGSKCVCLLLRQETIALFQLILSIIVLFRPVLTIIASITGFACLRGFLVATSRSISTVLSPTWSIVFTALLFLYRRRVLTWPCIKSTQSMSYPKWIPIPQTDGSVFITPRSILFFGAINRSQLSSTASWMQRSSAVCDVPGGSDPAFASSPAWLVASGASRACSREAGSEPQFSMALPCLPKTLRRFAAA